MIYKLQLPNRDGSSSIETIDLNGNLVIIGANGSGKTRFGVRIEELNLNDKITIHRISAQKALNIPDYAHLKNLEQAEKELICGSSDIHANQSNKNSHRWGNIPATHLLNDYDKVLSLLFAKSADRDRKYTEEAKCNGFFKEVPEAPIDLLINLWNAIMPHREIVFCNGKVTAKKTGISEYHGKEMSDGERVILYLIGQCLCLPEDSLIIIDEPELHLHKSLINKMWDVIEKLSFNKKLVYITHDLDFASSRMDAIKIWVKEYNGYGRWIWDNIPTDEQIPEVLMLEIIGNRKNIIFCEGELGKLDSTIYQLVYPEFHIIPRGSSSKVIEATKAFKSNSSLHYLKAYGLIDCDYKDSKEIELLKRNDIYTISVAEIENLFCIEPILFAISDHLELNTNEKIKDVIDFLIESLTSEFDLQVSSKAEKIIEYKLRAYSKESNSEQGLIDGLNTTLNRIDIAKIYSETKELFLDAVRSRDLKKLLLLYNRKSLINRISGIFGLVNGEYSKLLIRLLKGSKRKVIIEGLKQYLPEFK